MKLLAAALAKSGRSKAHIVRTLLGRETLMSYLTLFNFSKRNLVSSLLADLAGAAEDED